MDIKDGSMQDHKHLSSQVRIITVAGSVFSYVSERSLGFMRWPVETVTAIQLRIWLSRYIEQLKTVIDQLKAREENLQNQISMIFSDIWDQSPGFVRWPVETVNDYRRTICPFRDIEKLQKQLGIIFSYIWDQSPGIVRWSVEIVNDYQRTIWPFRDIEKLQKQIEQLHAEIDQLRAREGFLHARFYRVDVIFDPSTAHPRLEVSKDGKYVRDTGSFSNVSNNVERFDSHTFVLAKQGFSKGRHYWEVEVGQKKNWDLGVASESISRKGKITLAPQKGYWVIGLDGKKDYWARTVPWIRLEVSGKPTKIGVFLDMTAGYLSFYDVNGKKKLHIFTVKYSGKLYPFFSTGSVTESLDSQSLKIPSWLEEEETERNISETDNNFYSI